MPVALSLEGENKFTVNPKCLDFLGISSYKHSEKNGLLPEMFFIGQGAEESRIRKLEA
jgi:hypothetical protein